MTSGALAFLDTILCLGLADSTYDQYVNHNIRRPPTSRPTFYTKKRAEEGVAAAEAAFAQWERLRRGRDFAFAVEPIVNGMRALARLKDSPIQVTDRNAQTSYPIVSWSQKTTIRTALLINPEFPGCGCSTPKGANVFSRNYGSLEPRAITLQVEQRSNNVHRRDTEAYVGLVLPRRGIGGRVKANEFVVVMIGTDGYTNQHLYQPTVDIEASVRYSLGMISAEEAGLPPGTVLSPWSGGDPDQMLGFPGALTYLADEIQHLGPYLTGLAKQLSGDHTHGNEEDHMGTISTPHASERL